MAVFSCCHLLQQPALCQKTGVARSPFAPEITSGKRARETKKTKIANKDTRFLAVVQMRVKDGFENRYELAKQVPLPSGSKLHRREKLGEENDGHQ